MSLSSCVPDFLPSPCRHWRTAGMGMTQSDSSCSCVGHVAQAHRCLLFGLGTAAPGVACHPVQPCAGVLHQCLQPRVTNSAASCAWQMDSQLLLIAAGCWRSCPASGLHRPEDQGFWVVPQSMQSHARCAANTSQLSTVYDSVRLPPLSSQVSRSRTQHKQTKTQSQLNTRASNRLPSRPKLGVPALLSCTTQPQVGGDQTNPTTNSA